MKNYFELIILKDQLTYEYWAGFYRALLSQSGLLNKFEIIFTCTDNVVQFFIGSGKDLSSLSNSIEGLLIRPLEEEDKTKLVPPKVSNKERFVSYVSGGNILDLKEKTKVKRGKDLEYAVFKVRAINVEKATVRGNLFFKNSGGGWSKATKTALFFPAGLFAIDFTTNTRYLKKSVPKYLDIEKSLHVLTSDSTNAPFEIDTFPYFSHNYYLNLTDYEFDKHSFIIGASGSGKSKFISLFVDRIYRTAMKMNYRIVVIDPHASIAEDFLYINESKVINFSNESTELFEGAKTDISAANELTTTLFKSLMGDQFNSKVDRVLRFSLFVLFTAQNMSLDNLKRFLTDIELRNQILNHVSGYVPANIVKFFGTDFNELRTQYYNEAIAPIIALVDEMQLQPVLVGEGELSLAKTIQDNFLTVFSLNKVSMGEKVVKTVAGLLIQQIFLLAQARAFNQKVILIIDEVSVVQNPALSSILAEARKFNLSVMLTQQYFGQIEKDLRDAIFANVYNYYAFKVSEEDARNLEGNLNIELPKEIIDKEGEKGLKEQDIRVKIMTELHPRECLVRVLAKGQVLPAVKARTMDAPNAPGSTDQLKLKSYKQESAPLPEKFKEKSVGQVREDALKKSHLTEKKREILPENNNTYSFEGGLTAKFENNKKTAFNLSELLAKHSSSRINIKKRKEG